MTAPDPPTQLDSKALQALGNDAWNAINDLLKTWEKSNERALDADGVEWIIQTLFGEGDDNKESRIKTRQQLDVILKRQHIPTSKESLDLLAADKRRDLENARVGFVTEWVKVYHLQDQERTGAQQQQWQQDLAVLDRETEAKFGIDGKLAIQTEARHEVQQMTKPKRD